MSWTQAGHFMLRGMVPPKHPTGLINTSRMMWCVGGLCLLFGVAAAYGWMSDKALAHTPMWRAFMGGMTAAAATALGTLPALSRQQLSARQHDTLLGFGAGVMLAASAFSLALPALHISIERTSSAWLGSLQVGLGIAAGAALLLSLDRGLPHEHFIKGLEGQQASAIKRAWLFTFAIAIHNIPEGLAIGVAHAGPDAANAGALTAGISIQDIPEGLVVALALRSVGYGRGAAVMLGTASGLTEPLAAIMGATLVAISNSLLPWGLAFAAGAMLFVISHEVIPESHRRGNESYATSSLILGFIMMMVLDAALK